MDEVQAVYTCSTCKGTGKAPREPCNHPPGLIGCCGPYEPPPQCRDCWGTGHVREDGTPDSEALDQVRLQLADLTEQTTQEAPEQATG